MDENQIGPNINTTPVQRYVRDGPYPRLSPPWNTLLQAFLFVRLPHRPEHRAAVTSGRQRTQLPRQWTQIFKRPPKTSLRQTALPALMAHGRRSGVWATLPSQAWSPPPPPKSPPIDSWGDEWVVDMRAYHTW